MCLNCRDVQRSQIKKLQTSIVHITEKLSDVLTKVAALESKFESHLPASVVSDAPHTARSEDDIVGNIKEPHDITAAVTLEVHRELSKITRRKRNVIISGLPEQQEYMSDEEAFAKLCEEHLEVKPSVAKQGCKRLGKVRTDCSKP